MPTVVQFKFTPGGNARAFDDPITPGHVLLLFQYGRSTMTEHPSGSNLWHLLASARNDHNFDKRGWVWWREAVEPDETYKLPINNKSYLMIETDAVGITPVAVTLDTAGPTTTIECPPVTPEVGADVLIVGMGVVGNSDQDFDGPAGSRIDPDADSFEMLDHWGSFSPLEWAAYRDDIDSADGSSYTVSGEIESSWTAKYYAAITVVLSEAEIEEPPAEFPEPGIW